MLNPGQPNGGTGGGGPGLGGAGDIAGPGAGVEAGGAGSGNNARVKLAVSPSSPVQGQAVSVQAKMGDCPRASVSLTLDGQPLSYDWSGDGSGISTSVSPAAGAHRLALQSADAACQATASFEVLAVQCSAGASQDCPSGACGGTQDCINGRWDACTPRTRICRPGERVSCSSNTCSFGLAECNGCGTGWGECRPPQSYNN